MKVILSVIFNEFGLDLVIKRC